MPFLDTEDNEVHEIHFLLVEEMRLGSADSAVVGLQFGVKSLTEWHQAGLYSRGCLRLMTGAEFTKKAPYCYS